MFLKRFIPGLVACAVCLGGWLPAELVAADAKPRTAPAAKMKAVPARKPVTASKVVSKKTVSKRKHAASAKKVVVRKATPAVTAEPDFDAHGNPLIRSSAFVVQDARTGEILLEKNSHAAVPIASITKLMTAMVVLDARQSLSEAIEITHDDVDRLKGTSSRLTLGSRISREELLLLALMASENRAASALARNYPGGMAAFLEAVQVKTQLMGLADTRLHDGTGLNKHNVSSARDLAVLVTNASRYPLIREFSTQAETSVTLAGGRTETFRNTNSLVNSPEWQIDVSKTGYISESGRCLVMQAWMEDKPLVIVLLDSWGRNTRIGDANRIRKWLEQMGTSHPRPLAAAVAVPGA